MKAFKRTLFLLILIVLGYLWFRYREDISSYLKPSQERGEEKGVNIESFNFPLKNIKEKEVDLNQDGQKEILLTSFDDSGPHAVLVDAEEPSRTLSEVFDFSTDEFSEEFQVRSEDSPELSQNVDLNSDGKEELVMDLKDYGAYTISFGVLEFRDGKLGWVVLEEADRTLRPAIFRDGASVRHANIFRVLENGQKALVEIFGEERASGAWAWEVNAFSWSGSKYVFDSALSEKILKEQPVRFRNGEPIFE